MVIEILVMRLKALVVMSIFTLITLVLVAEFRAQLKIQLYELEAFAYQAIFIGLSVLTIPHMCLLEWVRRNQIRV